MSKAYDEVKVKNRCDILVIGPEARVYHHQFDFVTMVPRQIMSQKPSDRFKASDMGLIKGRLSRKEIYEDLV